ncbi:MAG TPA: ATP-binding cassette domain-containing protein [Methylomirabilota bacterium]|jgi:branched-chain amino acid transport system ATP-binding protein|nr:ATP-binding cassette domain-containing protein [Methylomirabilota bacterium]
MLKLEGVQVRLRGFVILRGITLEVPAGGLIGLVGRNGAGKTTTLKSISGILPVAAGTISFDGTELLRVPGHQRARLGIGYMPEDRRLIGTLTVEDNISLPAWASRLEGAEKRLAYIYRLMPDVKALAGRRASQLSGGQQKTVALARALMSGTKLLLLDEPFEGLSPALGEKLATTITELQQDGLSVLMAESDQRRIGFAQTIYSIERGEIV